MNTTPASSRWWRLSAVVSIMSLQFGATLHAANLPPSINLQPQSQSVSIGASLSLSVGASGTAPLRYQWELNGSALPGATNATLSLANVQPFQGGGYRVAITNGTGAVTSQLAVVEVDGSFTKITAGPIVAVGSGAAGAWGDYDNDGWTDLYVTTFNGPAFLFRNNGDGTFISITGVPISAGGVNSFGCAWADYDNDGFLDLLQGGYNLPSRLFHNNGNGTFSQVATGVAAGIDRGANNVVWGDYDNDGFVDLFIAISYNAPKNVLYHNDGNGAFAKVTNSPPVNTPGNSQGASWGDYDNDGRLDLVVNHTGTRSQLFHNDGRGNFTEMTNSAVSELSTQIYGGASWGDYDNDGFPDLFVSSYGQHSALYHNNGDGTFTRLTNSLIAQPLAKSTGGAWADYDNDGFLDLFVANDGSSKSFLYRNNGDGTFTATTSGSVVNDPGSAQGAAWGDYDNNGFPDLFVPNIRNVNNFLYRNNGNSNAWLTVQCEGRISNRAAIGAKVRVRATIRGQAAWQLREISGGGSLGSQNDLRAAFGLGDATNVDLVRVEWPSGLTQELTGIAPGQFLRFIEPGAYISPPARQMAAGETAVFTLTTTLPPPLTCQWSLNGAPLPGETNLTLIIANLRRADAGFYSVAITNSETGFAYTPPSASLTGPVVITQPPLSQNVRAGSNTVFSVVATGLGPLSFQWHLNGIALPGATNEAFSVVNAQLADEGAYTVVVSNSYGAILSAEARLVVFVKPVITVQPLSQTVAAGGSVTFSVAGEGHPLPLAFRWRKGGASLTNIVVDGTTCFFTVTNVQPAGTNNVFSYSVVVTNVAGSILSSNAVLTVLADTDGDGLPDDWELANGLSSTNAADAAGDLDGDGLTNLQEYLSGTNPLDALDRLRIETMDWTADGPVSLRFTAVSNKTYTIQSCPSLGDAQWSRVADLPAAPATRMVVITDACNPSPGGRCFYRLVTPRAP